ncbi:hypothetical protein [Viridibacterium curvum]|uniref:PhoD-like phosphatase metallophosphatase domain-containing protein n=1 Tax=Viridibacterium curvum TaxID=1101404 RepID=A0ABP9QRT3_9RHOO
MKLTAYAQAASPGVIQVWVGMFGTEAPPAPSFRLDQTQATPFAPSVMTPIRDQRTGVSGKPINHRGIFRFAVPDLGRPYLVEIVAGSERYVFTTNSLPLEIPKLLEGSFNILLCSCYFQPEDVKGLLGSTISQIQLQPHLTVMAGDQVYVDLPLLEDLPEADPGLSQVIGDKYLVNWTSTQLQTQGLEPVLARAPVVNVPDDHEFWNNYPFRQKQLPNTWRDTTRRDWSNAARALYEDYQLAVPPAESGATRLDVEPIKMLFLDMRCNRDGDFDELMNPVAVTALSEWANELIADRAAGKAAVGLLSSGQALFINSATDADRVTVDAEMGNYKQFDFVLTQLKRLANEGIPVVYLTGDVHWGRVTRGTNLANGHAALYEVISSPSRLIRVPFLDAANESFNAVKGIFGKKDPWPRHSNPENAPSRFCDGPVFSLETLHKQRGDHVAIVSFTRNGTGVDFSVTYYAIHEDKAIAKSVKKGPYALRLA